MELIWIVACVVAVWYLALWLRIVPDKLMCYWFAATLAGGFAWLGAASVLPFALNKIGLLSKMGMSQWSMVCAGVMMRVVRFLNPQMRVVADYSKYKWSSVTKGAHVLCNHTSFWDSLHYTCEIPLSLYHSKRTLMKSSLAKMPVAGWIFFSVMQNFKVFFNTDVGDSFSVDREKQEGEQRRIDAWLDSGCSLSYCPEGRMNPTPSEVLPMRFGSVKMIADGGHPIVVFTQWGNEKFWPIGAPFGGHAADLVCTLAEYKFQGGKPMPRNEKGELDVAAVATDLRNFMQAEVDRAKAIAVKMS